MIRLTEKWIGKSIELKTPSFETGVNRLINALYGGARRTNELSPGDLRGGFFRDTVELYVYNRRGLKRSGGAEKECMSAIEGESENVWRLL
jgi:hypothetical protein